MDAIRQGAGRFGSCCPNGPARERPINALAVVFAVSRLRQLPMRRQPRVANISTTPSALSLLVEARRSSWLRTTVDGESDSGRMLAQGETVRLNAKQSVLLRVGDAGAVFVSVNNGKAAALGRDGQVVTRQFVAESTERRAAEAAAQTPPPSPTNLQTAPAQKPAPLSSSVAAAPQTSQLRAHRRRAHRLFTESSAARAACRGHADEATCRCDAKSGARAGTSSARPS